MQQPGNHPPRNYTTHNDKQKIRTKMQTKGTKKKGMDGTAKNEQTATIDLGTIPVAMILMNISKEWLAPAVWLSGNGAEQHGKAKNANKIYQTETMRKKSWERVASQLSENHTVFTCNLTHELYRSEAQTLLQRETESETEKKDNTNRFLKPLGTGLLETWGFLVGFKPGQYPGFLASRYCCCVSIGGSPVGS